MIVPFLSTGAFSSRRFDSRMERTTRSRQWLPLPGYDYPHPARDAPLGSYRKEKRKPSRSTSLFADRLSGPTQSNFPIQVPGEAGLLAQPLWTTHVRISSLVETQFAIHVARQADAYTFADGARFPPASREPERAGGA